MLIWQIFHMNLYIILIFQTIFEHIKLQDTDYANNDLFHTGMILLKNLDRTFLCNLGNSLDKLFSFHRIYLTDSCKMLRCKSRDSFITERFCRGLNGISNRKNTRIKDTDNISTVSFIHHVALTSHHLLWLGKSYFFTALNVHDFHSGFKFSGTDTHECDPVAVRLIHIRLYFKDKCRKILRKRINRPDI